IGAQGLLEEIDLYEDKILDVWSRYQACPATGVQPRFRPFAGDNPVAYVLAKNVQRRHLSTVQILRILEKARQPLEAEAVARQRANLRHQVSPVEAQNSAPRGPVAEQMGRRVNRFLRRGSSAPRRSLGTKRKQDTRSRITSPDPRPRSPRTHRLSRS